MTTTKALEKLFKKITGKEARNSSGRILSDLADNWGLPTLPAPTSNSTKYYVLKVVKSNDGIAYTWDEKTFE